MEFRVKREFNISKNGLQNCYLIKFDCLFLKSPMIIIRVAARARVSLIAFYLCHCTFILNETGGGFFNGERFKKHDIDHRFGGHFCIFLLCRWSFERPFFGFFEMLATEKSATGRVITQPRAYLFYHHCTYQFI